MCDSCSWSEALEQIAAARETLSEVRDTNSSDAASDFCDSIEERLAGIEEWVTENEHVTERQVEAIGNMAEAAEKWVK